MLLPPMDGGERGGHRRRQPSLAVDGLTIHIKLQVCWALGIFTAARPHEIRFSTQKESCPRTVRFRPRRHASPGLPCLLAVFAGLVAWWFADGTAAGIP